MTCGCDAVLVRVKPEELGPIRAKVVREGDRCGGADLDGAVMNADYAWVERGFTDPKIKKTGELKRMVVYTCRPDWSAAETQEVIRRLEEAWANDGAFTHEAHTITVDGDVVAMDFVTWWDDGAFYTGRIEVTPSRRD
jgi:hypothetical protein